MGIRHREPSSQRLCRYLPGTGSNLAHRRKRTVSNEVAANCGEPSGQWQTKSKNGSKFSHGSPKFRFGSKDPQHLRLTCNGSTLFQNANVDVSLRLGRKRCENVFAKRQWEIDSPVTRWSLTQQDRTLGRQDFKPGTRGAWLL